MVSVAAASFLLAVGAALTPVDVEYDATRHLVSLFGRGEAPLPRGDDHLAAAARRLAQVSLDDRSTDALDSITVSEEASAARAFDPAPRAIVFRGSPASEALKALLARGDFASDSVTHFGVGAVSRGGSAALVVLLVDRKATLEPFPRTVAKPGSTQRLCGDLIAPLESAAVYLTRPDGSVERLVTEHATPQRFCASVPFTSKGRHTVEVVGQGPRGPEVAALFFVDCAATWERVRGRRHNEPTTMAAARKALLDRINALRQAYGLIAVTNDETLNKVAQIYSDDMATRRFLTHVSPSGSTLKLRLMRAGVFYDGAGENIAMASGPLAAHFGVEQSPGHRMEVLNPDYRKVGLGVTFQKGPGGERAFIAEIFIQPPRDLVVRVTEGGTLSEPYHLTPKQIDVREVSDDAVGEAYARLASWRTQQKLPALKRSPALDKVASELARNGIEAAALPTTVGPADIAFLQQNGVEKVSVETQEVDTLEALARGAEARRPEHRLVGLAAVRRPSGRFAVVLVYGAAGQRD
jgi:uncharacterized protein YkwD